MQTSPNSGTPDTPGTPGSNTSSPGSNTPVQAPVSTVPPTAQPARVSQPSGTIFQFAYTTPDAHETALAWTSALGIGPWFVRGPFSAPGARYRGASSDAHFTVARTFSGGVMVELIQQHDEHPSIYREAIERDGYGFHHVALTTETFDERAAHLTAACGEAAFTDVLPSGSRVAFFDPAPGVPGMTELVEVTATQEAFYASLRAACAEWNGSDPWRAD